MAEHPVAYAALFAIICALIAVAAAALNDWLRK